jgi:hypothetical protein
MQSFFGITGGAVEVVIAPLSGNNDGTGGHTILAVTSRPVASCTSTRLSRARRSTPLTWRLVCTLLN